MLPLSSDYISDVRFYRVLFQLIKILKRLVSNIRSWIGVESKKESSKKKLSHDQWRKERRKRLELRLKMRVEKDILRGDVHQAINRYEGFFQLFPVNQDLHYDVATLYLQIGDQIRAGKHFYFQNSLSNVEQNCVKEFEKSCGNDSILILRRVMHKLNFKVSESDVEVKKKLKILMDDVVRNYPEVPKFLGGAKRHLDKAVRNNEI
ncbi:MAG: hypothetical protein ACI9N1_000134 [Flavobacteriales bacterium]|jgi:hypothetical protein